MAPRRRITSGDELRRVITRDVTDQGLELDPKERALLDQACVVVDRIAELDAVIDRDGAVTRTETTGMVHAHPALVEARQHRAVLARLLSGISLEAATPKDRAKSRAGAAGARARWGV